MESLNHEIAVLEMRAEQLRIHLCSIPPGHPETRRVGSVLSAMRTKIGALRRLACTAGRGKPTLH
jgi:hypothetical protein